MTVCTGNNTPLIRIHIYIYPTGSGSDYFMEILAKHVEQQLKRRGFCVVFEDEVERCWPMEKLGPMERKRQIEVFAESRGWNAFIHNSDFGPTRAIFLHS